MWLFFEGGFVSVVKKPGDRCLCVRARVAADLDRFRAFCPSLSPTTLDAGTDYSARAWASPSDVARAAAKIAKGIAYGNFKHRTAEVLGADREALYGRLWSALLALEQPAGGPQFDPTPTE